MFRASLRLLSFVALGSVLATGCGGRGGLGDFDNTGVPGEDAGDTGSLDDTGEGDTDVVFDSVFPDIPDEFDSDIFVDVPPIEDTDLPPFDSGFETSWPDTGPFDTGRLDTGPFDTGRPDTTVFDTGPFDTGTPDTGAFDTSVFDTDILDTDILDTGVLDTGFDAPPEGGILCGGSYCNAASQECCASLSGTGCVTKGSCSGGTTLSCSSSASCSLPGQVCCLSGLFGGTPSVNCQFFCAGLRLCASNAECTGGQTCQAVFGGYRVCR